MTKTISAAETSAPLAMAVERILENPEPQVLERDRQPQAVLLSFAEYEQLHALQEQVRRQAALAQLWELAERVRWQPPPRRSRR